MIQNQTALCHVTYEYVIRLVRVRLEHSQGEQCVAIVAAVEVEVEVEVEVVIASFCVSCLGHYHVHGLVRPSP